MLFRIKLNRGSMNSFEIFGGVAHFHEIDENFVANLTMKITVIFRGQKHFQGGSGNVPPPPKKALKISGRHVLMLNLKTFWSCRSNVVII